MNTVPLYEAVQPNKSREECGRIGESLFALSDWLQNHRQESMITASFTPAELKQAVFDTKPPIKNHNHWPALLRIARNAKT